MYNTINLNELEINHIIALCNIIDDYEDFYQNIKKEYSPKNKYRFLRDLHEFSVGKRFMILKEVKRIYNSNKNIIDIINEYDSFYYFLFSNYSFEYTGMKECKEFKLIREYIENNKDHINDIIALLEKLKGLGFESFKFSEKEDFSKQEYSVSTKPLFTHVFNYVNNIEILPGYDTNIFHYKTSNSPYRIDMTTSWGSTFSFKSIILNSLLFDISELPNSLSKEDTYDKIVELAENKKSVNSAIRNSIRLDSGINNLEGAYQELYEIVKKIKKGDTTFASSRENVGTILSQISDGIKSLRETSTKYDRKIISNNPELSFELLTSEKRRYRKLQRDTEEHIH